MVKWCAVIYIDYFDEDAKKKFREILIRELDTKEEAEAFLAETNPRFEKRGQLKFSKIMKRDMSKHKTEFWL